MATEISFTDTVTVIDVNVSMYTYRNVIAEQAIDTAPDAIYTYICRHEHIRVRVCANIHAYIYIYIYVVPPLQDPYSI